MARHFESEFDFGLQPGRIEANRADREMRVQVPFFQSLRLKISLGFLVDIVAQDVPRAQGKLRRRLQQFPIDRTGPLHLHLYGCQSHRFTRIDANRQPVLAFPRGVHPRGNDRPVVPKGFQGLPGLSGRLPFETLQPHPVHLAFPDECGRDSQGRLDIGQLFSRKALDDDPNGLGCRKSHCRQDEEANRQAQSDCRQIFRSALQGCIHSVRVDRMRMHGHPKM